MRDIPSRMRIVHVIAMALLLAGLANAQEHKVTVEKYVLPDIPVTAIRARIGGDVKMELSIASDGTVQAVTSINGAAMLQSSAKAAITQWRFHCLDCSIGQPFLHTVVFSIVYGDSFDEQNNCGTKATTEYAFPDKLILKLPACYSVDPASSCTVTKHRCYLFFHCVVED